MICEEYGSTADFQTPCAHIISPSSDIVNKSVESWKLIFSGWCSQHETTLTPVTSSDSPGTYARISFVEKYVIYLSVSLHLSVDQKLIYRLEAAGEAVKSHIQHLPWECWYSPRDMYSPFCPSPSTQMTVPQGSDTWGQMFKILWRITTKTIMHK